MVEKNKKKYMPSLSNQIFIVWKQVISNDINFWFQACEDALHDYDISLQIETEENTKSTQSILDMQTKEAQTTKTFFKDKAILKKEVMQSKGTQYVRKAYEDANVQCTNDISPTKDASVMKGTLDDSVKSENDLDSSYRISDDSETDENDEPRTMTIKSLYTGYVVY